METANLIVIASLGLAAILVVVRAISLRGELKFHWLDGMIGRATWSFTESWASTFTGISALLGLFLALQIPVETVSNADFALLNVFFGALALVAALLYTATGKTQELEGEERFRGTIVTFLIAGFMTLWAVFGQIGGLLVALLDVASGQQAPATAIGWLFAAVLVLALGLLLVHAWRSIAHTIKSQWEQKFRASLGAGKPVSERWNLL